LSNSKKFAKNSLALTTASLSITFLGAIYRIFIANYLGDVEFGKYSFITTYVSYFSALSLFGLRSVVTREVARHPEKSTPILRQSIKIRGLTTLIAFISAYCIILFTGKSVDIQIGIVIFGLSLFAVAGMDVIEGMIVARESSVYITISALFSNALKIFVGILVLRMGYGLIAILTVYLVISFINTILSWYFYRIVFANVKSTVAVNEPHLRGFLIRESVPFVFLSLISRVYYKNDIIILSILKGDRIVGWYSAAYLPVDALLTIAQSIANAAYPIMSRMFGGDGKSLKNFNDTLSRYMLLLFIPIAITLTAIGPELISFLFSDKYTKAMPIMRLLGWMPVAETVTFGMGNVLAATYNQKITAKITVVNASINLVLCLVLIPKYSYWGGAIGTVLSAYITLAIVTWVIIRYVHRVDWLHCIFKPLCCALLAVIVLFFTERVAGPWISWITGIVTFIIIVLVSSTFRRDDYKLVVSIFRKPI